MRKLLISFVMIQMAGLTFGQNVVDLVRYSNLQLQGSARFEGMAGSFGALGSDISSSLINPAGYGRYSSSQFAIGFNYNNIRNNSDFQGQSTLSTRNVFRPSNLGIVFANDVSHRNRGFLYNQFGFSYNRVDNLTNRIEYNGRLNNSLLDVFAGSEMAFKENILPLENVLSSLEKINCITFDYNLEKYSNKGFPGVRQYGVIAQEIQSEFPDLVKNDKDGDLQVNYTQLSTLALQAVKELSILLEKTNERIANLEKEIKLRG